MTPNQKKERKEDREYCKRCGTDITIIRLHDCINGARWADYGNLIYNEIPIEVRKLVKLK